MTSPIVLITGALTGIGRATALAFARDGATVIVSGRREPEGQALAAELKTQGAADAAFIRADVREETDVRALIEQTVSRFSRLDVAVNNAGFEGATGPITEQSAENYEAIFDTNVRGVLFSLKHQMRAMLAQGSGSIVNLSSVAGLIGFAGASVYVASKHAVEGLTKSAALEGAAAGVRVNAVAPGPIQTDMLDRFVGRNTEAKAGLIASLPAKRAGTVDEIAQTIVFLASDKARYLTGQSIAVDGGFTAQ
ncbi:MAG: glucose 1-dehydrogenase [Burkholderiales bacterium]|nr:glucose 1-dehydrogenase [Burkholderiales bacterium]